MVNGLHLYSTFTDPMATKALYIGLTFTHSHSHSYTNDRQILHRSIKPMT